MKTAKILLSILFLMGAADYLKAQKGEIYINFPESFENTSGLDEGYRKKDVTLKSGVWTMYGAKIDSFANDQPKTGTCAIRMLGDNTKDYYLSMNFDVPDGVSKVTFWYSSYAAKADKPSALRLDYSTDGGKKWKKAGDILEVVSKEKQQAVFNLDIKGPVRFRLVKPGLGNGKEDPAVFNGRSSIDDFAVYKNQ